MEHEVTVFRSADSRAEEDAAAVREMLAQEGIAATSVDDSAPGVPEGAWEVRVARADAARAEALVNANPVEDEMENVDPSHALDLVTVFRSSGTASSEVEVMSIKSVLESNGIYAVVTGSPAQLRLPEEVKVAKDQVARAKKLIAEAKVGGRAAADEAEAESEKRR